MLATLSPQGWRSFLKIALLIVLWQLVTFVLTTSLYVSVLSGASELSLTDALFISIQNWLPWILLSPAVVILAGIFRFHRETWLRSLLVHLFASLFFALIYEGLLTLFDWPLAPPGMSALPFSGDRPPDFPGGPRMWPHSSNSNHFDHDHDWAKEKWSGGMPPPMLPPADTSSNAASSSFSPFFHHHGLPPHGPIPGFQNEGMWTHFFRLAMVRTQYTFPVYWCIVCFCWGIHHLQEMRERERHTLELEARLNQANLRALRMQLQPHFLFNTLNAISSLIHENPKAADDMIGALSQLLRTTLDMSPENEVPLRRELDYIDDYLDIQQTRFGERLQVVREIDPQTYDVLAPPFILQPLVENALRYGVESREANGIVTIRAQRKGDMLHLEVSDNGEGFKGGSLPGIGSGIGLSNTKSRLQELYGDKHLFKLSANQPTGACVTIEIPFRPAQPNTPSTT